MNNMTRFRVYNINDSLCGIWHATSEISAIQAAIKDGYDAWSASSAHTQAQ